MGEKGTATPPPLRQLPTAKEKKYDRQLRLWGAAGQEALENSHLLLINNGPGVAGVETLKNLVLPGIGQFTILDSAIVSDRDLGVNFFLDDSSLGKFRAQETAKLLMELNPDVNGHAIIEPVETFITKQNAFAPFTLIIVASPINPNVLDTIQNTGSALQAPVFYCHSCGFYSHVSVSLPPAFPIVDTHPDPDSISDLRLLKPWTDLETFAKEKTENMESMSPHDKAHIPYICLLLHYLGKWRDGHEGRAPSNYKEKSAFRDLVRSGSPDEENFDEAVAAVLKSLNPPTAPSSVREMFNAPEAQNLTAKSPSFWVITKAVAQFYQKFGELPLPGAVPDMKAQSTDYIKLQSIYKSKARQDCVEVLASVRQLEKDINRPLELAIDEKEVENFCKGSAHIHLVRGKRFHIPGAEIGRPVRFGSRAKGLAFEFASPDSLLALYIAFLAWDEYIATHSSPASGAGGTGTKVPGSVDSEAETDAEKLIGIAHTIMDALIKEADSFVEDPDYSEAKEKIAKVCAELTRSGGAELHNIASLTGGMVAQEVIKVITRQYIPIDNTLVFDGVSSKSQVLRV